MTRYEIQKKLHVSQEQKNMVETAVLDCIMMARKKFPASNIPFPEIRYDLIGKAAGQAVWRRYGNPIHTIRINPILLNENQQHIVEQTVPHEMAHVVVNQIWKVEQRMDVGGHGREWKHVMRVFGLVPERCHNLDTSSVSKLKNRPEYHFTCRCPGRVFKLSGIKYNRWANGVGYQCPRCKTPIRFDKKIELQ